MKIVLIGLTLTVYSLKLLCGAWDAVFVAFSNLPFMRVGDGGEEISGRPTRRSLEAQTFEVGSSFLSWTVVETFAFIEKDYFVEKIVQTFSGLL